MIFVTIYYVGIDNRHSYSSLEFQIIFGSSLFLKPVFCEGAQERKIKEFNPKVKKVMSLSEQKLQCLLCYKKFSSKQETTDHIRTRHRITLAGSIDKSMRSVFS